MPDTALRFAGARRIVALGASSPNAPRGDAAQGAV
jgi:hypothetical protein